MLNIKNIITLVMLLCFIGQTSASVVMSCSKMMTMQQSNYLIVDTTVEISNKKSQEKMDHNQHNMMSSMDHTMSENTDDCCADACLCDMVNCSTTSVIHQVLLSSFQNNLEQNTVWFVEQTPQSQYLDYLFKPPISS